MALYISNYFKLMRSNRPIEELDEETDFLGTIQKGKMIKSFIEKIGENRDAEIQMLGLYGDWGSGKTTLMKWIEKQLSLDDKFETVFFEAWKHESDTNIALSLASILDNKAYSVIEEFKKQFYLSFKTLFKGALKSTTLEIKGVKIASEKFMQEINNYLEEDERTFHEKNEEFKKQFSKLEDSILGEDNGKQLIVFVDDLDRCEPENVLQLLSVIKLFFTYGKRTVFVCGIDKEAVNGAVKHKYNSIIKSDEYLEKIFDISFNMQKANINKMIKYYLPELEFKLEEMDIIVKFFNKIDFLNARHIKKVLHKYLLLKYFKEQNKEDKLIPDLNNNLYRMLVIFIIILYEFEIEKFNLVKEYDSKLISYSKKVKEKDQKTSIAIIRNTLIGTLDLSIVDMMLNTKDFASGFCTIFAPDVEEYQILLKNQEQFYFQQFSAGKCILSKFSVYLYTYILRFNSENFKNDKYKISNLFKMAELYL